MKHRIREMTWVEVKEAVDRKAVCLIPAGAIEQHGYHLPIDTDNVFVSHICDEASRISSGKILTLPVVHYGYNAHNMNFPGTIHIRFENLINYYYDVGASLAHHGFDRIIFVNGHASNSSICEFAARKLTLETQAKVASVDHWKLSWDVITSLLEGGPHAADHACEWETSEYLAIRPDLVQMDLALDEIPADKGGPDWQYPDVASPRRVAFMDHWHFASSSGVSGTPTKATAEKGKQMLDATIKMLVKVAREFRDLS